MVLRGITSYGKAKRKRANSKISKRKTSSSTVEERKQDTGLTNVLQKEQEDTILREFDLNYHFGPCVGIGRLTRWQRAYKLGLDPPKIVLEILEKRGSEADENVFQKYKSLI